MLTVTAELAALFDSGRPCFQADLWTITLLNGTILRYTSADVDLVWGGQVYSAHGPIIKRGNVQRTTGLDTDTLDVTVIATDDHLVSGRTWPQAIRQRVLSGSTWAVSRLYADDWSAPVGVLERFSGTFGELYDFTPYEITFSVNGATALLDILMPREVYSTACTHTIYSPRCTLSKSAHAVAAIVSGTGSYLRIPVTADGAADAYALGELEIVNGSMAGVTATIRSNSVGELVLMSPLPELVAAGTSVRIYPGCDGTRARCRDLANIGNFRGFPLIPTPETIV